jgi:very-short-patch-repair endonuclease
VVVVYATTNGVCHTLLLYLVPMKDVDTEVSRLAARQRSLVHRRQALALGMTGRQLERRVEAGLLVPVQPVVYRISGAPPSWGQDMLAACMSAGPAAVASHRAAALLWGLRGVDGAPVELTVPGTRRPRLRGAVVHRTIDISRADVNRRAGIPVAAPALTLVGLAAVAPTLVESALEDAVMRGLVSMAWLARTVDRLGGRGHPGTALVRALVAERDPSAAPTESRLEDLILRILLRAGLPEPVRQYRVDGVRVDLAYPPERLGIEADGRIWHGGRLDVERNSAKGNVLVHHGWRILHFTWADAKRRPAGVVESVARELGWRSGTSAVG